MRNTDSKLEPLWFDPNNYIVFDIADVLFMSMFTIEMIIKVIGLGWETYWRYRWNKFDLTVLLMSYLSFFVSSAQLGVRAQVIRAFRLARIFRLTNKAHLQSLFETFIFSLPSLWNITFTLLIIFYIFSVIGMNLFYDVEITYRLRFDTFASIGNSSTIPFYFTILDIDYLIQMFNTKTNSIEP